MAGEGGGGDGQGEEITHLEKVEGPVVVFEEEEDDGSHC